MFIENSNFIDGDSLKEQEIPITFLSSHIMLDLKEGSQTSIDFLYSIYNSPNPNIKTSTLIQEIIYYKWNKLRWIMHIQAFIYVLYMLTLLVYVLYFIGDKVALLILITISMILLAYEAYQLWASPISYIKDLWNYIDLARSISSILYFAISLSEDSWKINHDVLSFLVIISCLRGISYFRIFENTRYMVNLISEVMKDMTSFLILLIYSVLSFAFIFLVLDENDPNFVDYLKISYRFIIGDFDTSSMNSIQWICFILVTMINMIVMLNLLISIIGDTFGNVQVNSQIADTNELIGMIIELETMLINNRNISEPCFFQICVDSNSYNKKDKINKILPLKNKIKILQAEIAKNHEETEKSHENMKVEIIKNNEETKKEMDKKLEEMMSLIKKIDERGMTN